MTREYELLTGETIKSVPINTQSNFIDLTGWVYGQLEIVAYAGRSKPKKNQPITSTASIWIGKCSCGTYNKYAAGNLQSGQSTRCRKCSPKHRRPGKAGGQSRTSLYCRWSSLVINHPEEVCDRWKKSFLNFYKDVKKAPEGKILARIDEKKKFGPKNYQWTTYQKFLAKRNGIWYTFGQKSGCMSDWARWLGITCEAVRRRLKKYPPEIALSKNFETKSKKLREKEKNREQS